MTQRRGFLAALLAPIAGSAKAAQHDPGFETAFTRFHPNCCPVCGTMAAPYRRPRFPGVAINCSGPADHFTCTEPGEEYGPTERLTRCRICNAAFWQDAERAAKIREIK